ncbi:hypothetical protein [Brevundimonas sp.]|uniref:hypothetical protein n=1 Tax=Brevundimonas sp. TaxID=1871086 RepID=UPI0035623DA3
MFETHPDVARRAAAGLRRNGIQPPQQIEDRRPDPRGVRQAELPRAARLRIEWPRERRLGLVQDEVREVARILRRGRRPE